LFFLDGNPLIEFPWFIRINERDPRSAIPNGYSYPVFVSLRHYQKQRPAPISIGFGREQVQ
jgi:hypothetical protein